MKKLKIAVILVFLMLFSLNISGIDRENDLELMFQKACKFGEVRVIIEMDVPDIKNLTYQSVQVKTGDLRPVTKLAGFNADLKLEDAIFKSGDSLLSKLCYYNFKINRRYSTIPFIALSLSPEALMELNNLPEVISIVEDKLMKLHDNEGVVKGGDVPVEPQLDQSAGIVGAPKAWSVGITGKGWYVAILDTGVRRTHEMFKGKNIVEACYSALGDCPNGKTEMVGAGSATPIKGVSHGTHVAGIAAGKSIYRAGVSKDSDIIAIQIFSYFPKKKSVLSYGSDQLKALEYVYSLRNTYKIAAANMSLGGGEFSNFCNDAYLYSIIKNLTDVGIATVISTGNEGHCNGISSPSCIENAISVGATRKDDLDANFSNWKTGMVDLFAPGVDIMSATAGNDDSYGSYNGTSMAAPHVTGAWALIKQLEQGISVPDALKLLQSEGKMITTSCPSGGQTARINVGKSVMSRLDVVPPTDFSGEQFQNRSLLLTEFFNELTWRKNNYNILKGNNIVRYKLYKIENSQQVLIDSFDSDTFFYRHRKVSNEDCEYAIKAVTDEGKESIPAYFTVKASAK